MSGTVIGSDWASRYPAKFAGRAAPVATYADPCPVCANPTGDCSPNDHPEETVMATATRQPRTTPPPSGGVDPATGVPTAPAPAPAAPAPAPAPTAAPARPKPAQARTGPPEDDGGTLEADAVIRRGFTEAATNPQVLVADCDVVVEFTPPHAKRTSRMILFPRGLRFTRPAVTRKLAQFQARPDARMLYRD